MRCAVMMCTVKRFLKEMAQPVDTAKLQEMLLSEEQVGKTTTSALFHHPESRKTPCMLATAESKRGVFDDERTI